MQRSDLAVAGLTAGRRVFGKEIQLDAGQFLIGNPVTRLPDELQFPDGDLRPRIDTDDEELSQRERLPRGAVEPRWRAGVSVGERPVERVGPVMAAWRSRELT